MRCKHYYLPYRALIDTSVITLTGLSYINVVVVVVFVVVVVVVVVVIIIIIIM